MCIRDSLWREGTDEPIALETSGAAQLQGSSAEASATLLADEGGLWRIDDAGKAERIVSTSGVAAQPRYVAGEAVAAWVGVSGAQLWTCLLYTSRCV